MTAVNLKWRKNEFILFPFRFDETAILKRRERRIWEEKRTKILFEYQQFSGYGSSTALLMYELAWKMSRDTNDLVLLWDFKFNKRTTNFYRTVSKYIKLLSILRLLESLNEFSITFFSFGGPLLGIPNSTYP